MSDSKWMPDWQSLQQQFASAWADAAQRLGAPKVPMHEGFDLWAKLFQGREAGNEVLDRTLAGARQFVDFLQGAAGQLGAGAADAMNPTQLREWLTRQMGQFSPQQNPVRDALRAFVGDGARSFESLFQDFLNAAGPMRNEWRQAFNLPAFGYTREHQERQQQAMAAWVDYQEQLQRYNQLMLKASQLGLERFESKLAERSEPGRELGSVRALYDLYIDAAEEAYAEVALGGEFREVYGALVNAQMRVRKQVQDEAGRLAAELGLPTRAELDATHRKVHELRHRVADLEAALAGAQAVTPAAPAVDTPSAAPVRKRTAAKPKTTPAKKAAAPTKRRSK